MSTVTQTANCALSLSTDPTATSVHRCISFRPVLTSRPYADEPARRAAPTRPLDVLYPSLYVQPSSIAGRCAAGLLGVVVVSAAKRRPARGV